MRSLVVPGIALTIATFFFIIELIKVLLPTFGLPTIDIFIPSLTICNLPDDYNTFPMSSLTFLTFFLASSNKRLPTYIILKHTYSY